MTPCCPRCGSPVREEQAHIRCPQCGVVENFTGGDAGLPLAASNFLEVSELGVRGLEKHRFIA